MRERKAYTRRGFLKTGGLVAGGFALSPLVPFNNSGGIKVPTVETTQLKIGLLLPRSNLYPDLATNFTTGLELYLRRSQTGKGSGPQLVSEDIGFGSAYTVQQKAEKLLTSDKVDLATGLVNPALLPQLDRLFATNRTLFVANSLGENVVRQNGSLSHILQNSLYHWQTSRTLGHWAAKNLGRNALVSASTYESGYDALYTFQLGFEEAGGKILHTRITHTPNEGVEQPSLKALVSQFQPDFIYAAYSGSQAVEFVQQYAAGGLSGKIPLIGSGFLVTEDTLATLGEAALGIISAVPWAGELDNPENQAFTGSFQARTGKQPDSFAMLGFETGRLIAESQRATGGDFNRIGQGRAMLSQLKFNGLRGATAMDAATGTFTSPLYLQVVQQRDGLIRNTLVEKLAPATGMSEPLANLMGSVKTGWSYSYLCI